MYSLFILFLAGTKSFAQFLQSISYRLRFNIIFFEFGNHCLSSAGFEIATNTVAFATKFFPLRLKYLRSRKFATCCHLRSFETKGLAVATFAATFAKINK